MWVQETCFANIKFIWSFKEKDQRKIGPESSCMNLIWYLCISGNKGEAEIDLQQIQDGVVLKLQERLSFCWQCKWRKRETTLTQAMYSEKLDYFSWFFSVLVNTENLIHFLKVAKYNKLYLCGSKLPTNLSLKSKARTMVDPFRHLPS